LPLPLISWPPQGGFESPASLVNSRAFCLLNYRGKKKAGGTLAFPRTLCRSNRGSPREGGRVVPRSSLSQLVRVVGFEPTISWPQTRCLAKFGHTLIVTLTSLFVTILYQSGADLSR